MKKEINEKPAFSKMDVSGSALIAEYMGIKEIESSYDSSGNSVPIWYSRYLGYRTPAFGVPNKSIQHLLNENKFNESWDWLMPVVEKICTESYDDGDNIYLRTFGMMSEGFFMVRFNRRSLFMDESLIKATYLAVVDFIRNRV